MKKLFILASLLAITTTVYAQKIYRYKGTTFEYFEKDTHERICWADGNQVPGKIYISKHLIKLDWNYPRRQVYAILSAGKFEVADEGYFTRSFILVAPMVHGVKVIKAVMLFDPKHRLTDVIFKNSDTVNTTYSIRK